MKFTKAIEVNEFLRTVEECKGDVWLMSPYGDKYVLKSTFSRYIAMAALLSEKGNELELFCHLNEDEHRFFKYFDEHPGVN